MKFIKVAGFSVLLALVLIILMEGFLRLLDLGAPSEDPFLDISGDLKVYEKSLNVVETREDRQRLFRTERFEPNKPSGMLRVFCLGGSTVYGFPYNRESAWPALLQRGLNSDNREWEVINSGGIAYASYRVMRVMDEIMGYEPDAIVIMTGHNEFLEKRVYAETLAVNRELRSARTLLGRLYLFNLVRDALSRTEKPKKMLLGENISWDFVPRDEQQKKLTEEHFRYALQEMAQVGRKQGIPVIFATMPSNLKDYPPLGGLSTSTDEAHLAYADGLALEHEGKVEEAYAKFRVAADLDEHPVRAFSSYNDIIRKVAAQDGCYLADIEKAVIKASGGLPGNEMFLDHVHMKSNAAAITAMETAKILVAAGLLSPSNLPAVLEAIDNAAKAISPREEAMARYGAAYESYKYLHRNDRAVELLVEALKIDPSFIEAKTLLEEIPSREEMP